MDTTFGRGGHSAKILAQLGMQGSLIALDKDPQAITHAKQYFIDQRFKAYNDSFINFAKYLAEENIKRLNGVLMDLGVSSPQINQQERGFSFINDGPLDMRMNNLGGVSAYDVVNNYDEMALAKIFWEYGEEKMAKFIAHNIVQARMVKNISSTIELANLISNISSYKNFNKHPATRVFQALRIEVNQELTELKQFLTNIVQFLAVGARIVVISFHSLEDRIVKESFNKLINSANTPRWVTSTNPAPKFRIIAKKIRATFKELEQNTRSRSAILRCLEKISD